jgi:hypothetical protein
MIYPVAIGRTRAPEFAELASVTGGRSIAVRDPRELAPALTALARELRSQYLLGYAPAREPGAAAAWHAITVALPAHPGVRVRARDGYFSR